MLMIYTDTRFLSKTQLVMINQMQNVTTRRSLSSCTQLTKTSGSKRPAFDLSLTVVFAQESGYQCNIGLLMHMHIHILTFTF